jgi:hypothetical protein
MNGTYRCKLREAMSSPVETRTSHNCVRASIPTANAAMTYQGDAKALPLESISSADPQTQHRTCQDVGIEDQPLSGIRVRGKRH